MRSVLLAVFLLASALPAAALDNQAPTLWQERFFWDALLTARDRLARQQSDPMMIPVMKAIAGQVAQQVANLAQIHQYVKAQGDNLRYAYAQPDPQPSLDTIINNFETLTTGCDQVAPPSVVLSMPMPKPSNGSPNPRYSVSGSKGSISSAPTARLPTVSVMGCQFAPASTVFQTPPPEVAR